MAVDINTYTEKGDFPTFNEYDQNFTTLKNAILGRGNVNYVEEKTDLPTAVSGVITLSGFYILLDDVDLTGDRIECSGVCGILSFSSELATLSSTGLSASTALITATETLILCDLTLSHDTLFDLDGIGNTMALNWVGVNFLNVGTIGTIQNFDNFIFRVGAFINSAGLTVQGEFDSLVIESSLLQGDGVSTILTIPSSATVNRRIRIEKCPVVVGGGTFGFDVDVLATIEPERYILSTNEFSGAGTYLRGLDYTSEKSLFDKNIGIQNTAAVCQLGMQNNTTDTVISTTSTPVKVAGNTSIASITQKFTDTDGVSTFDNRAIYTGEIERFFKVSAILSSESGNNNQVGIYVAKNGTVITDSKIVITENGFGKAENAVINYPVILNKDDYIEIFVENNTSTQDIRVTFLNVLINT